MSIGIYTRLSGMMFLEFFIWGAWFVTMGSYLTGGLGFSDSENALAYATQSWGAIVAPFVIGLIADKYVNAERLLGAIHLIGAVLMYRLANVDEFGTFYPYLLLYMILYMPTLALVNAISFRQLDDPAKRFGFIRFWGTVGWIVAGLLISFVFDWDARTDLLRNTFTMAAAASLLLGVFGFTLPRTPPQGAAGEGGGLRAALGVDALALLRDRNFLVFFVASILICIPLAFYYQHANQFLTEIEVANAAGIQTIGQMSEVGFMLLVPLFLKRFGMKTTLLIGMLAWAARYVLFACGDAGGGLFLLIVGIALHGVCYDFFFVSGQVFTDSKAGPRCKSAAQGLITLATYGVGMLIGFWAAGELTNAFVVADGHDWRSIWLYPAVFAAVVAVAFALLFRNEAVAYGPEAAAAPARDG